MAEKAGQSLAVDVRGWQPRGRGIDLYTSNILCRWATIQDVNLTLVAPRNGEVPSLPVSVVRTSLAWALLARVGIDSRFRALERHHDAVFLPNMTIYPKTRRIPVVMTVHDATSLLHRRFFTVRDRISHRLVDIAGWLGSADRLLANSEHTRSELLELGVSDARIRVIHHGIGERYQPATASSVRTARMKYRLGEGSYFLFVGAVERRKNVSALVRGFHEARRRGLDAILVIAGPIREPDQLEGVDDDVRVLGWVDEQDKPALYSGATAAISLAQHEGFGMLPLEAFACCTRSILSRLPVYAETIGEQARYVDSDDPTVVAQAFLDQEADLAGVGLDEVSELRGRFSWDNCARETLREIVAAQGQRASPSAR